MLQTHYQTIRPVTTAHLAQTMTLLSLTVDELQQQINAELSSNPALEIVDERRCPTCQRLLPAKGPCPVCSCPHSDNSDEPVIFISPREDFYSKEKKSEQDLHEDIFSSTVTDLPTYVLHQIAPELQTLERSLAAYLLTHLDEDGLLTVTLFEAARYFHIPVSRVERIQQIIQLADPIGVGSCSTQEALLIQVKVLSEIQEVPKLVKAIIRNGMGLLSRHQYSDLAHEFETSVRQVKEVMRFISENLNPFPGRSHWGDVRQPTSTGIEVYHHPDIIIRYLNEDPEKPLVVEIILPVRGTLRVNPMFRRAIKLANKENKESWKRDLDRASLLVKCLQQRSNTMQRLMHQIVTFQKNFILLGERYLKPITRARISKQLDVHESTISRAVAHKTVQLPNRRIIPLSAFFDRSLSVRTVLRDIISEEMRPMSDAELAKQLAKEGFKVARRTVAKYRSMEGILPAHLRHSTSIN